MLEKLKQIKLVKMVIDFVVKRPLLSVIILLIGLAGFAYSQVEMMHFTSSPGFCKTCHPGDSTGPLSEVHTWEGNIHAKAEVSCLDCHGAPGAVGYLIAKMGGMVDTYGELFKSKEHKLEVLKEAHEDAKYAAKLVPSETCLFCHSDAVNAKTRSEKLMSLGVHFRMLDHVENPEFRKSKGLTDIIEEGVKPGTDVDPKHKTHMSAGLSCLDCHHGVAHGGEFQNKPKMQTCFDCHDKRRPGKMPANDDCSGCHRKVERIAPTGAITFGSGETVVKFQHSVHLKALKCNNCHSKLFKTKKGSTKIVFADHNSDKFCYSCHNGKTAFGIDNCTGCHAKSPMPATISFAKKGMVSINFNHEGHAKKRDCADCHTKLFAMKKGGNEISMDAMYQGKFCGSCHNGKTAFAVTTCAKCHKGFKPPKVTFKTSGGEVVFSHDFHTQNYKCTDCHTKLFPYKVAGAHKATMAEMEAGKACGACHNKDKDAFSVSDDCSKCHKM